MLFGKITANWMGLGCSDYQQLAAIVLEPCAALDGLDTGCDEQRVWLRTKIAVADIGFYIAFSTSKNSDIL